MALLRFQPAHRPCGIWSCAPCGGCCGCRCYPTAHQLALCRRWACPGRKLKGISLGCQSWGSSMAGPKFDQPDVRLKMGARSPDLSSIFAQKSMLKFPARSSGRGRDLETRLHGQSLRRSNGTSFNSEPRAPIPERLLAGQIPGRPRTIPMVDIHAEGYLPGHAQCRRWSSSHPIAREGQQGSNKTPHTKNDAEKLSMAPAQG